MKLSKLLPSFNNLFPSFKPHLTPFKLSDCQNSFPHEKASCMKRRPKTCPTPKYKFLDSRNSCDWSRQCQPESVAITFLANEDLCTPGSVADGPVIACDLHVHRREFVSTTAKRASFRPLQLLERALHDVAIPLPRAPRRGAWPHVLAPAVL